MISIVTAERATEIIDNLPSHPGLIIKTLCLYRQGASFSVHGPRHSFGCLYAIPRGWERRELQMITTIYLSFYLLS
jgi:hypothetical protein